MAKLIAAELTNDRNFRAQCEQLRMSMGDKGEPAKYGSTGRTRAEQANMVARGVSKTMQSDHRTDLFPDNLAHAADIVHKTRGWGASSRFWLMLGWNAKLKGLQWGGLYGLKLTEKRALVDAMATLATLGWPSGADIEQIRKRLHTGKPVNPDELALVKAMQLYNVKRGWDSAHVGLGTSNWP